MQGGKGVDWDGVPGGKFSLGRWREGSGYCVGAVVESRMGDVSEERGQGRQGGGGRGGLGAGMRGWRNGKGPGEVAGNGMRGVWVVGEGFFRGVGAVFDVSTPLFKSFSSSLVFSWVFERWWVLMMFGFVGLSGRISELAFGLIELEEMMRGGTW